MDKKTKKIPVKKVDYLECSICCEKCTKKDIFDCPSCKFENCKTCLKTYLIETTQEQHCMNCKNVIPYEKFMEVTDKTWRLGTFKKHREKVLWDKEISRLPEAMVEIKKRSEIHKLNKELKELEDEYQRKKLEIIMKRHQILNPEGGGDVKTKSSTHYEWTQVCPKEGCRGFLDK